MSAPPQSHPFAVKVLRLGNPSLQAQDVAHGPTLPTTQLVLPRTIGQVYVGEKFRSLLSINNISTGPLEVRIQVEIHSPTGVHELTFEDDTEEYELVPGTATTKVVTFEPTVSGQHSMIVKLRYTVDGEARAFRKTFRFDVHAALGIRTRVLPTKDAVAIEAQVENLTEFAITISNCTIVGSETLEIEDLGEQTTLLRPRDIGNWGFIAKGASKQVGSLTIKWLREPLGAVGWMTSDPIRI